jgi:crotonobetainyl-CoA:carnitine CoA-transferase CaiB-like acyl-CoA transferase
MEESIFSGLKIIELSDFVAGPYCGKLLADLGAEVIKIEQPGRGDTSRERGPFPGDKPHREKSGLFLYVNNNKLGVTLDLESPGGRELFLKLTEGADVLIEDRPPGKLQELKLGYEDLSAINPGLIVTSITPFGQNGPYRNHKAYHLNVFHGGGQGYMMPNGVPELPPVKGGGLIGLYDVGLTAAIGTVGALMARFTTGTGQHVDISMQEATMALERVEIARYVNDGEISHRVRPRRMVGGLLPCKDGHVVMIAPQQHQWEGFVDFLGNPEWAQDERCKDEMARADHAQEINPLIQESIKDLTREDIYHGAQANSCPVGSVNNSAEVMSDRQIVSRGFFQEVEHPQAGSLKHPTAPYQYSATPWRSYRSAPLLGEHNIEIFRHRLGYSEDELKKLSEAGTI